MLKILLWLGYLRKKRIIFLSIAAVAISSAMLIVVASLFTGFINAIEQSAVDSMGDVVLSPPIKFTQYPQLIERIEQISEVEAVSAVLYGHGLLHLGKGNVKAVQVYGIEPGRQTKVNALKDFLVLQKTCSGKPDFILEGMPDKVGGFVGIGVLAQPDEQTDKYDIGAISEKMVGDNVVLTMGVALDSVQSEQSLKARGGVRFKRRVVPFTVKDIVFTGIYEMDKSYVYVPIKYLRQKLYPGLEADFANLVQVKLRDDCSQETALNEIRQVWTDFATNELGWNSYLVSETDIESSIEMQKQYVAELRKQMGILLLIIGAVSLSSVLLVFCIFYMIVETKQKDIAVIKSCGTSSRLVAMVFIGFGGFVGLLGSILGVMLGWVITQNINPIEEWIRMAFGFKLWESSVYIFSKIPNQVHWESVWFIAGASILAAIVGALVPALVAVRTRPVNILRYE